MAFPSPQLFALDSISLISFSGQDRLTWLNSFVTNDLRGTSQGKAVECFVTDVKGRTLSHGIVFSVKGHERLIYLSLGAGQGDRLLRHFERYILREDVRVTDLMNTQGSSTESSESGSKWFAATRDFVASEFSIPEVVSMPLMSIVEVDQVGSKPIGISQVIACPIYGDEWCLFSCAQEVANVFSEDLESDESVRELLRIRQKWPMADQDYDDKNLPQELDRNATAISFHKGCYLGQETVARLDALGQVQKKLVHLKIESEVGVGRKTPIEADGKDVGLITSVARLAASQITEGIGYVRRSHFAAGTIIQGSSMRVTVG